MIKLILAFFLTFVLVLCIYNIIQAFKFVDLFSAIVVTLLCSVVSAALLTTIVVLF